MIYLIQTTYYNKETKEIIDLLKIGYTKDLDKRFNTYLLHNPECKLLDKREGDIDLENYFHKYYSKYKYPNREEWFYYNQEIVDNFQSLQIIKGKLLSKEEYIERLKKHLKSLVSTVNQLKSKYLSDILKESKEKYPEEFDKNRNLIINRIIEIWEYYYNKEMSLIESFDYTLLESELTFTSNNMINLDENPWKNSATFYYRATANYRFMKEEDFKKELDNKILQTNNLIAAYREASNNSIKYSLATNYQKVAKSYNYKDDYVAVNTIFTEKGNRILKPVMNNLVYVNELRAFRIQQIDYKDRFTVFSTLSKNITPSDLVTKEVSIFLREYESLTTIHDKLKILCECDLSDQAREMILAQIPDSDEIKSYYIALTPEKLKALSYNTHKIKKELKIVTFSPELLIDSVYSVFKVGDKILLSELKQKLADLYKRINYSKTPKANDIMNYFDISSYTTTVIINGSKKRAVGYELILSHELEMRAKLEQMEKRDK